jgi:hypothetical protein
MHSEFFTKLFVVAAAEPSNRVVEYATEFAAGIFIIEDIICWILLIFANAIDAFYYVDSISVAIEMCVYITQITSPW